MEFSIDNMSVAVVARPPYYGASPESHDAEAAMAVKGVVKVVELGNRLAVCAETTYSALQGRRAFNFVWSKGSHPDMNDETLDALFQKQLSRPGATAQDEGDVEAALTGADRMLEQSYRLPYLSRAQYD